MKAPILGPSPRLLRETRGTEDGHRTLGTLLRPNRQTERGRGSIKLREVPEWAQRWRGTTS
eukprot:9329415-Alexandrium_andersonii.AAC.1